MTFDRWDIVFVAVGAVLVYALLAYRRVLPSIGAVQDLANVVNTKGGNILVLFVLTLIFFFTGIGLIYWSLNRMLEGKLSADNAVLMMGLSWILGTAFGGSFSSMLKVMSGDDPKPPPGTSTISTASVATVPVNSKADAEKIVAAAVNAEPPKEIKP